jgi:hypothetical protein
MCGWGKAESPLASDYSMEFARDPIAVVTHLRTNLVEHADEWETREPSRLS